MCSICKVNLLDYEALARKLLQLRINIIKKHKQTNELYQDNVNDSEFVEDCSTDAYGDDQSNQDTEEHIDDDNTNFINQQYSMRSGDFMEQCSEDEIEDFIEKCSVDFEEFQDREEEDASALGFIERCSENSDLVVHCSEEGDAYLFKDDNSVLDELTNTGSGADSY